MKKLCLLITAVLIGTATNVTAQTTVQFDATLPVDDPAGILGYANVFETPANGSGFVFGSAWGVADLKTVVNASENTVTLQPNFNTWDPGDPFWVTPTGEPNKVFEGNTYIERPDLIGQEVTFEGNCISNTIDATYQVKAYIRVFNADFSVQKEVNAPLVEGENFSITYTDIEPADTFLQYGFTVAGFVADPADEAALGSVVTGAPVLGVNDADAIDFAVSPNPTNGLVRVNGNSQIQSIKVFNVLGQLVLSQKINATSAELDLSPFQAGAYLAEIQGERGSEVIRIMKQ